MKLKIIDIDINKPKPKATIHYSGKLGFNIEAIEFMGLQNQASFLVATDEEKEDVLYLLEENESKNTAKVAKAGNYYYLNVGDAFDTLNYDYKGHTIMFDITKDEYEGKAVFILKKRREIKRKQKDEKEEDR